MCAAIHGLYTLALLTSNWLVEKTPQTKTDLLAEKYARISKREEKPAKKITNACMENAIRQKIWLEKRKKKKLRENIKG